MTIRLAVSGTATLGPNGGTALGVDLRFGPSRYGETWQISRLVTSGASAIEPECKVYRGPRTDSNLVDTTKKGNGDISETDLTLLDGEFLTVQYQYGSPGAIMTFRLEGEVISRAL